MPYFHNTQKTGRTTLAARGIAPVQMIANGRRSKRSTAISTGERRGRDCRSCRTSEVTDGTGTSGDLPTSPGNNREEVLKVRSPVHRRLARTENSGGSRNHQPRGRGSSTGGLSFYYFRHTMVTLMQEPGIPAPVVMGTLKPSYSPEASTLPGIALAGLWLRSASMKINSLGGTLGQISCVSFVVLSTRIILSSNSVPAPDNGVKSSE
jgi:hypothetical protein